MEPTSNKESTGDVVPELPWSRRSLTAAAWGVGLLVIGIIGVAFRSSWGSGRDAALAVRLDPTSADLYMIGVDGVIVVAVAVMFLLRHVAPVRRYCLAVILVYTIASLLINVLHGFGVFAINPATGVRPMPPWPVILLVASLAVSTIAVGSHLLVLLMLHLTPTIARAKKHARTPKPATAKAPKPKAAKPVQASAEPESDAFREAVNHFKKCHTRGDKHLPGERFLSKEFGLGSKRQGRNAKTRALEEIAQERLTAVNGSGG